MNAETEKLLTEAKVTAGRYEEAKSLLSQLSDDRITYINELREREVSWAQIGRVFGISPQAAMYVSGHAKRTPAKNGTTKKKRTRTAKKS